MDTISGEISMSDKKWSEGGREGGRQTDGVGLGREREDRSSCMNVKIFLLLLLLDMWSLLSPAANEDIWHVCECVCIRVRETGCGEADRHVNVAAGKWLFSVFRQGNGPIARSSQQLNSLSALYSSLCPFLLLPSPNPHFNPVLPLLFFVSTLMARWREGRQEEGREREGGGGGDRMQIAEGHWGQILVSPCQNADKDTGTHTLYLTVSLINTNNCPNPLGGLMEKRECECVWFLTYLCPSAG